MPIICHTPTNHLGCFRKGSALSFTVGFQALRAGLFEVSAVHSPFASKAVLVSHPHIFSDCFFSFSLQLFNSLKLSQQMRLKLQFTAAPGPMAPTARKASPSSPMVRELHSGLGRSQSFSHQQLPRNGQFTRSHLNACIKYLFINHSLLAQTITNTSPTPTNNQWSRSDKLVY